MQIWHLLDREQKQGLRHLQRRLFNTSLNPPFENRQPKVRVEGKIESLEEINHLMRQPPRPPQAIEDEEKREGIL